MKTQKKVTAGIAGLLHHIKTEEESIRIHAGMPDAKHDTPVSVRAPAPPFKSWGFSGRQVQMKLCQLLQMRTFR